MPGLIGSAAMGGLPGGARGAGVGGPRLAVPSPAAAEPTGAADLDDVEDILQQVRRDVRAMQQAPAAGQAEEPGAPVSGMLSDPGSGWSAQTGAPLKPLNRCQSESIWNKPGTRDKQDGEAPRAAQPKAAVRGRYVFGGGAESQVLTAQLGRGQGVTGALSSAEPAAVASFSPRLHGGAMGRGEPKEPPSSAAGGTGQSVLPSGRGPPEAQFVLAEDDEYCLDPSDTLGLPADGRLR